MPKRKVVWSAGDLFGVPLLNGRVGIGQVLDLMMPNVVRCAFYSEVFPSTLGVQSTEAAIAQNLIALIACSCEQLDYQAWKVLGNKPISIPSGKFPNHQFRKKGWVGAKLYDAAIVEAFLNAFHALTPWDDWFDPKYLDKILIEPSKKPGNLILTKSST